MIDFLLDKYENAKKIMRSNLLKYSYLVTNGLTDINDAVKSFTTSVITVSNDIKQSSDGLGGQVIKALDDQLHDIAFITKYSSLIASLAAHNIDEYISINQYYLARASTSQFILAKAIDHLIVLDQDIDFSNDDLTTVKQLILDNNGKRKRRKEDVQLKLRYGQYDDLIPLLPIDEQNVINTWLTGKLTKSKNNYRLLKRAFNALLYLDLTAVYSSDDFLIEIKKAGNGWVAFSEYIFKQKANLKLKKGYYEQLLSMTNKKDRDAFLNYKNSDEEWALLALTYIDTEFKYAKKRFEARCKSTDNWRKKINLTNRMRNVYESIS